MSLDIRFREFYDVRPGLDNLRLPVKICRVFIRYTTRTLGYNISLLVFDVAIKILANLRSFGDVTYLIYLLRINRFKIQYRRALYRHEPLAAIKKKIEWAEYALENSVSAKVRLNARGYLSLLRKHEFYHRDEFRMQSVINSSLLRKSTDKKIYIYGPNSNKPPNIAYKDYLLVVLKPVDFDLVEFERKLLFVNGAYYFSKMADKLDFTSYLIDKYGEVIVSSLSDVSGPLKKAKFPLSDNIAAPQALGRIIYNLIHRFGRFTCVIEGFDFYISNSSYAAYYPTLTRTKGAIDEKAICHSLADHDALYNFLYVKELCNYLNIEDSEEFKSICDNSGEWYLTRIHETRNFATLKNL